jgi:hypothetical protein
MLEVFRRRAAERDVKRIEVSAAVRSYAAAPTGVHRINNALIDSRAPVGIMAAQGEETAISRKFPDPG